METNYRICCNGEVIGTSMLEHRDAGMGTASGKFEPAPGYEKVRAVFRMFSDAQRDTGPADEALVEQYYQARDELNLSLETADGHPIATEVVHVMDFAEEVDEHAYEVEVHLSDSAIFDRAM